MLIDTLNAPAPEEAEVLFDGKTLENWTTMDGSPAEWLAQTVIVGKDPVEVAIPIAHDDPAGSWSLTLTDSFTDDTQLAIPLRVE